ncbi:oxaloacetate decarboxylase [Acidovorax sp. SRB_24]|uniref:isocitrate lyase/PEP mutase family protein n=1 Tax=Acidovorax sp. SRB_24 TaxID=1962700 RepID=UPI00145EDCB7|nr:isocitrate lyase/PEP mutase family protein [Acidovorax sp. SRB_24]NMM78858.1 carboxyvinyl-carboxyphosphonate phosphorylmutase [Acidovorax sp. SRB_24]
MTTTTTTLRDLLAQRPLIVAPGAYDAISSRAIETAGFPAVYMTGSGTAASRGFPDFGLLTMSEMVENAGVIARSVALPVIADADTGYGNELNVTRTVREYESRGVAAIHIEDQVSPKRCGHLDGKDIVPRAEFISKISAAVQARRDLNFVIIARTDALAVVGMDEAIARANEALAAGADVAFVEAARSTEELARIPRLVKGPCLLNMVMGGKTPVVSLKDAEAMGYKIAIQPGILFRAAIAVFDAVLDDLNKSGVPKPVPNAGAFRDGFDRFSGLEWEAIRARGAANQRGGL